MKKVYSVTISFLSHVSFYVAFSQLQDPGTPEYDYEDNVAAVTIGILQGGGSLLGVDFEVLASDRLGLQFGAGLIGLGAGINYHLQPRFRSSFFSISYWNQGFQDSFVQSLVGPTFVYRGKKWFTAQIGIGYQTRQSNDPDIVDLDLPSVQLLYSIGAYFTVD